MFLSEVLFPNYTAKIDKINAINGSFVHYTSADVAVSILKNKQVWMRNATLMNDYKEIEYGIECVEEALKSPYGARFKAALDTIDIKLFDTVFDFHNKFLPIIKKETYLLCISEHLMEENNTGRLSMWRAYGGTNGVAIVLNRQAFLQASDGLQAYTSPVAYLTIPEFVKEFEKLVINIEANLHILKHNFPHNTTPMLYRMLQFAILCTKHPGFQEEREWRIINNPTFGNNTILTKDVEVVRGVPQIITKLNLKNNPALNLNYMEIPELVEKIIIGPSNYPFETSQAIISLLESAGHKNASHTVITSDIPLRQI